MGVYVKGMKMPETCGKCKLHFLTDDYVCCLITDRIPKIVGKYANSKTDLDYRLKSIESVKRPEWCPLVMAIGAIERLSSAQLEERTKERTKKRTETHACDLIKRQDAIDALERIFDRCEEIEAHLPEGDPDRVGYKMYPDWLKVWNYLRQLPSAQPNLQPTCNQLATDCISRQAAIDSISADIMGGLNYESILKKLPSAERPTGE